MIIRSRRRTPSQSSTPKETKSIYEMVTRRKNPAWADRVYNNGDSTIAQDTLKWIKREINKRKK